MKIVIAINNLMQIAQPAYANHSQFWYRLGKMRPDDQFIFFNPQRMSIDRMRNEAAKIALEQEADYLVFLDDDVLVPIDGIDKLLSSNFAVTSGVTLIRGYPFYPMLFDFANKDCHYVVDWQQHGEPNHPDYKYEVEAPCDAVGFSFCMIDVSLLRAVTKPYFMTGPNFTEDVYFCQKVKVELGNNLIGFRKDVTTGHILGLDVISPEIRQQRIDFEEACDPTIVAKKAEIDRSQKYLDMVKDLENVEV